MTVAFFMLTEIKHVSLGVGAYTQLNNTTNSLTFSLSNFQFNLKHRSEDRDSQTLKTETLRVHKKQYICIS